MVGHTHHRCNPVFCAVPSFRPNTANQFFSFGVCQPMLGRGSSAPEQRFPPGLFRQPPLPSLQKTFVQRVLRTFLDSTGQLQLLLCDVLESERRGRGGEHITRSPTTEELKTLLDAILPAADVCLPYITTIHQREPATWFVPLDPNRSGSGWQSVLSVYSVPNNIATELLQSSSASSEMLSNLTTLTEVLGKIKPVVPGTSNETILHDHAMRVVNFWRKVFRSNQQKNKPEETWGEPPSIYHVVTAPRSQALHNDGTTTTPTSSSSPPPAFASSQTDAFYA